MVFPVPVQSVANTNVNAASPTTILMRLSKLIPLSQYWINEQEVLGKRVARYRKYYEGDHDAKLTPEMRDLLRVLDQDDGFTANFMPTVVDTKADRCIVQTVEGVEDDAPDAPLIDTQATLISSQPAGDTPNAPAIEPKKPIVNPSSKWAQDTMDANAFDVIQGDEHEQTIRDGNGYLMTAWDNDKKQVCFTVEPAWDGQTGVLMVYRSHNVAKPYAAIKIWQIEGATAEDNLSISITTRCNIYYEDRVEKFQAIDMDEFAPFVEPGEKTHVLRWDMVDGKPIGLPVVHFRNGGRENYGVSELRNALGLQNALNRFHYSAVMAAELTAFAIYVAIGFPAPAGLVPGMIVNISEGGMDKDKVASFEKLAATDITPILNMIDSERRLISEITRTPSPDLAAGSGSNKSGEYLKQLEVGLIGKVRRFTTRAGSSWEQVFDLAWKIQQAYGTVKPPPYKRFICKWRSPEIRNDAEVVTNAMAVKDVMGEKQTLRNVAAVFDLTEDKIEDIMAEKKATQLPLPGVLPPNGSTPGVATPVSGAQQANNYVPAAA